MNKKELKRLDAYQLKKYGITWKQRMEMFQKQDGKCALCFKPESLMKRRMHTDHNHRTKKVRALVCFFCNRHRIGRLNEEWALRIYNYFKEYDK